MYQSVGRQKNPLIRKDQQLLAAQCDSKINLPQMQFITSKVCWMKSYGSGGSASGRATDFCPSGLGSIPGSTWPWFFPQTVSILAGRWALILIRTNHRTILYSSTILSNFLSSASINKSIVIVKCLKRREINPKRGREWPIFKKNVEWKVLSDQPRILVITDLCENARTLWQLAEIYLLKTSHRWTTTD